MNGDYIIRRARAIGVTFFIDSSGDLTCKGPVSRQLREVVDDNKEAIVTALLSEHRVIEFEPYRIARDSNRGGVA